MQLVIAMLWGIGGQAGPPRGCLSLHPSIHPAARQPGSLPACLPNSHVCPLPACLPARLASCALPCLLHVLQPTEDEIQFILDAISDYLTVKVGAQRCPAALLRQVWLECRCLAFWHSGILPPREPHP